MKKYLLFLIIIKLLNFSTNNLISNDALFAKDHVIHDLKLNVTWLRCSVGQVWNEKECVGKPLKFKISEVDAIIKQANNQLEGDWRLPNRKELENIVCMTCGKVKINSKFFPNTPYEPFWTGEKNNWSKNKDFYWSVNFFTGHTFGRFPGHIPNFVRLVKDR